MKTVLLLTHHLDSFAGSEINTYELSLTFKELGYIVEVGTFSYGYPIKQVFEQENINVKNLFLNNPDLNHYDLIWAQHAPVLLHVLFYLNIKYDYLIFSSLSPYEPLEVAPVYLEQNISLFLANSQETREKMIEEGVDENKIHVLTNSVREDFYNFKKNKEDANNFQSVAIVSNHVPLEIYELQKLLLAENMKCTIYGIGNIEKFITPQILSQYDLVITIGKTVQYALAMRIPVYVYDHFGGDGWVTLEKIDILEKYNFSGRYSKTKLTASEIYQELISGYSRILGDTNELYKVSYERYSFQNNLQKILSLLKKTDYINKSAFSYIPRTIEIYTRLLKNYQMLHTDYNFQLQHKKQQLQQKEQQFQQKEQQIQNLNQTVAELHELAQSMRVKNRLKRGVKKVLPKRVIKISKFIKHNPHSIKQGWQLLRSQGLNAVVDKIKKIDSISTDRLLNIYHYVQPILSDEIVNEMRAFKSKPLISIIMPVYNVDSKWLKLAIDSVENQWYENWELCIVDDKSTNTKTIEYLKSIQNEKIKIKFLEQNLNISGASNEALKMAGGEYIALMDNDDELTPDALYEVVKAINEHNAEFIYSDEDKIEMDGSFCEPHFKPDFAPDMFLSQNYISHLGIIKKELIEKVGGWEVGLEGSQDYDLYLKVLEHTDKIFHITKVLYHWRKIPGSTAAEFGEKSFAQEAGKKALENAINRRGIKASVSDGKYPGAYRINYKIIDNPLISIIIPFKDKPELLKMCVESILKKSTYDNFEIIGISNNSQVEETFKEMQRLSKMDKRVSFYEYNVPFNFSDINNHAVKEYAKGEHIVLLNNDIEIITSRWLEELLMFSQREDVGVVGAKLYYPNETIQHAGVIVALGGVAGHSHKYFQREDGGYFHRLHLIQNLSALTAAMFMVKKEIYHDVGRLNEENLKVAFNDIDFCLRVREQGYLNIFNPYCEAYHHESISRGAEDSPEKVARFNSEVTYMKKRHKTILQKGDPYYNPNLTLDREDFSLQ